MSLGHAVMGRRPTMTRVVGGGGGGGGVLNSSFQRHPDMRGRWNDDHM